MPTTLPALVWYFLKRHKGYLFAAFLTIILASLEVSLGPFLLGLIIDAVSKYHANVGLFFQAVFYPALFYVLITVLHNVLMRFYGYISLKLFPKLRTQIITKSFDYLSLHSRSFFQQHFSGNLANKISDIAISIETIVKISSELILARLLTIIIAAFMLSIVNVYFSIVLLVWVVAYVGNGYRLAKKTTHFARAYSEVNSLLKGEMVDSVANTVSAKIFSNISHERNRVETAVNDVGAKDRNLLWHMLKVHCYQNLIYTTLILFLLIGLIYGRMQHWVTIGDFAFVLSLSVAIAGMVNALTQAMPTLAKAIGTCQQAMSIIITPHEIKDAENAKPIKVKNASIEFSNVNFGYSEDKLLFKNLSLTIPAGQKVGLVGFSGGGKTTLVNLILRLYDIQAGEIMIDKQNIKSVICDGLRQQIAMIPQDPELFHRTIMDNIRYGDTSADDEAVFDAARLANCHEFILELSDGYQSMVGERGVKLSGGQRQRIAIARAILKQAPILVLDEATSSLDSITENLIQNSLRKVMNNKTTIVIAHRLSTLLEMDRILFLKDGKIVEDGDFNELRAIKDGYFAKLWAMQVDGFLPSKT